MLSLAIENEIESLMSVFSIGISFVGKTFEKACTMSLMQMRFHIQLIHSTMSASLRGLILSMPQKPMKTISASRPLPQCTGEALWI